LLSLQARDLILENGMKRNGTERRKNEVSRTIEQMETGKRLHQ
jgi:hypothetical protein